MARPRSEDKERAILEAAVEVFAERGLAAPTSAISRAAGVAEGTLFTYFRTKDDLVDALYRSLKLELAEAVLAGFPAAADIRKVMRHLWEANIRWALAHPARQKTLGLLKVSRSLSPAAREAGGRPFAALEALIKEAVKRKTLRNYPFDFMAAMLSGLSEATLAYLAERPGERERKAAVDRGFEVLWNGLAAD